MVYIGENQISNLENYLNLKAYKNVFLVTGNIVYDKSGVKEILENMQSVNFIKHTDFSVNPEYHDIVKGIERFKQLNVDAIVAVGGGSVLDMAKLINSLSLFPKEEIVQAIQGKKKIEKLAKPLILLPTTSGTGSEATHFAVAYYQGKKYSVASQRMLPELAIVDSKFTYNAPKYLTAATGIDAFAQALESYWSVGSTHESRSYAKEAIELSWKYLKAAVVKNSKEAKQKMSIASHLAGKAINISKTTAPHALSYYITSNYNLPHGHAVAITLSSFLEYNYGLTEEDCNDSRGVEYVKSRIEEIFELLGTQNVGQARQLVDKFIADIGLEIDVLKLNIDLALVYQNVNLERVSNNPRKVML